MKLQPLKSWYVLTPAGRVGPYINCQAAHDAADSLGHTVFAVVENDDGGVDDLLDGDNEDDEDDGVLGYEDYSEGGYDSDYTDE